MKRRAWSAAAWFTSLCLCLPTPVQAGGFTYQGKLMDGVNPADGLHDFEFRLYSAVTGGTPVGNVVAAYDIDVSRGLFTVSLDFGSEVWDGSARFLEIRVGIANGPLTALSPRQPVSTVPYAYSTPWDGLTNMPAGFADGVDNESQYQAGAGLQVSGNTISIDTTGAQQQQALCFVNGGLNWGFPAASRLRLPWSETIDDDEPAFAIENNGGGAAGRFEVQFSGGGRALEVVGHSNTEPSAYIESNTGGTALRVQANQGRAAYLESATGAAETTLYVHNTGTGLTMFTEGAAPQSRGVEYWLSDSGNVNTAFSVLHSGQGTVADFRTTNINGGSAVVALSQSDDHPVMDITGNGDATAISVTANHGRGVDIQSAATADGTTLRAKNFGTGFTMIVEGASAGSRGASISLTDPTNASVAMSVNHAGTGIGLLSSYTGSFGSAGMFQTTDPTNDAASIFVDNHGTGPGIDVRQHGNAAGMEVINNYTHWEAIYAASLDTTNPSSALFVNSYGTGRGVRVLSRGALGVHSVNSNSSGLGRGGEFYLPNTANSDVALTAFSEGLGPAFFSRNLNPASPEIVFGAMSDGLGPAAQVTSLNPLSGTPALDVSGSGTGSVARFDNDNQLATAPALMVETNGRQPTGYMNQMGQDGNAARAMELHCTNPGNMSWALTAYQAGMGGCGYFEISRSGAGFGHALSAVSANNVGALYAESTYGSAGNPAALVRQQGPNTGLYVEEQGSASSSGFARAGEFFCGNPSNASPAVVVTHLGMGRAGTFNTSSSSNPDHTLTVHQSGSGSALQVTTSNTVTSTPCMLVSNQARGEGARFQNGNSSNPNPAMVAQSNGLGPAARFDLINSGSGANAVMMSSAGTGDTLNVSRGTGASRAALFTGNVHVNGTLSATVKNFAIDHPADPANRVLNHASIESSEMLNLYSGNALLDAQGQARVTLPGWFTAVNTDFRYQLTCVGSFQPVYVAQEITDGAFVIAGGQPGMKVSWQVTARRNDAFAQANPMVVEAEKSAGERGRYMHPELYGQPAQLGIGSVPAASQLVASADAVEPGQAIVPERVAPTSPDASVNPAPTVAGPVVVQETDRQPPTPPGHGSVPGHQSSQR